MKLNTLEKLYNCLYYEQPEITLSEDIIIRAQKPIERMLDISAKLGL
jgi:quinolinate synthase